MTIFVLIHGSWHGAWCWKRVVPILENKGHLVFAPDLPGHGKDTTPIRDISLQSYVDTILRIVDSQTSQIVLVGHSRGGIIVSRVAELRPDKIKTSVYLSAFLLKNGQSMIQVAANDFHSVLLPNLRFSDDRSYHYVAGNLKEIFYEDCSDQDASEAINQLVLEPTAPIETPLRLGYGYERVPRLYIECLNDKALSPSLQKEMYTATHCDKILSMNTSHSPFLSRPSELVDNLLEYNA